MTVSISMRTYGKSMTWLVSARKTARIFPSWAFPWLSGKAMCCFTALLICWVNVTASVSHADDELFEEVNLLLNQGYIPDAIYFDQITKGNSLYAIVEAAAQSDPHREAEFRYLGEYLVSGTLPKSACGANYHQDGDWRAISYDELDDKTIEEVATLYFEDGVRLARFQQDYNHGYFQVSELAELIEQSPQWYEILPVRNHPNQDAVFVSIYLETETVSVDGNLGKIAEAQAQGKTSIPVILHYYPKNILPVGGIDSDHIGMEVIDMFKSDSIRLSPVPNWKNGDFHTMMSTQDLEDLFDIPEQEDIDEDLWQAIESDILANGITFPILIQMAAGKGDINLYSSRERIAVARSLGETMIPVTFFYEPKHDDSVNAYCARLVRGEDGLVSFSPPLVPGNPGGPPLPPIDPPDPPIDPPVPPPVTP